MKKSILCIMLVLALCLCLVLVSCKKDPEPDPTPTPSTDTTLPGEKKGDIHKITDQGGDANFAHPNEQTEGETIRQPNE